MAQSNKKFNVISIVVMALLALALIMGIVGICIVWLKTTNGDKSSTDKLSELISANDDYKKLMKADFYSGLTAIKAFGILTIIFAALTLCSYVASKFLNIKLLKWVTLGCAVLLFVWALLALILTFTCTNTDACNATKDLGTSYSPAAGPWLLSIFGMVGGIGGAFGALKA